MDADEIRHQRENEIRAIEQYREHPITKEILAECTEGQQVLLARILDCPLTSIQDFFDREQALGHLRGLRRLSAIIDHKIEEVAEKLKEETE